MSRFFPKNLNSFFLVTLLFFLLIFFNYIVNLMFLKNSIEEQQKFATENVSQRISSWFDEKINSTKVVRDVIEGYSHKNDYEKIKFFLYNSTKMGNFKNIYVGYKDNTIISGVNYAQLDSYITTNRPWYKDTIEQNKTILTMPYIDLGLKEMVISICSPLRGSKKLPEGVVCSILPFNKVKNEIVNIALPYLGITYFVNYDRKCILYNDNQNELTTSSFFDFKNLNNDVGNTLDDKNSRNTNKFLFAKSNIQKTKWYIVMQFDKSAVYKKVTQQFFVNILIYIIGSIIFFFLHYLYHESQRKNKKQIIKTEAILSYFIEYSKYGVMIEDSEQKIIYYNKIILKLMNLNELIKKQEFQEITLFFQILPLKVQERITSSIKKTRKEKNACSINFALNKDDSSLYYKLEIIPILSQNNTYEGLILFLKDITQKEKEKIEKIERETIIFQESKMMDLGAMIATISHQWRQPLNSISILLGNLKQFRQTNKLTDEIFEENLKYSMQNIKHLSQTIDTFNNFYKQSKYIDNFNIVDATHEVCEIIMGYLKILGVTVNIYNEISYEKHQICMNYKNEYQQILVNLLSNAKDAILENKNNPMYIDLYLKFEDNYYFIEIHDFGNGIEESFRTKLFRSFQTTKTNTGTGKGLYIAKLLIKRKLGGELNIKSFKKPTIFALKIPSKSTAFEDNKND